MKKFVSSLMLGIMLCSSQANAAYETYYDSSKKDTPIQVFVRGLGNVSGFPFEISSTLIREIRMHSRLWPLTYPPRLLLNLVIRGSSGVNDTLLFPWYAAFSDDTSPWSRGLGLPDYPWQIE